jgi:hypothetical protein
MTTNDPYSAERVRAWAVQQYPSGTPLDQDRRMVAAETEAYLSGRTGRETSELSLAAKYAGPVDPPESTAAEVDAALTVAAQSMPAAWWGGTEWRRYVEEILSAARRARGEDR